MHKIAVGLTDFMIRGGGVTGDQREACIYGWTLIISAMASLIIILGVGACLDKLAGALLFVVFLTGLRVYSGGFHALSTTKCFLFSILFYGISVLLYYIIPGSVQWYVIFAIIVISGFIVFFLAPMDHPHKPQGLNEKERNQRMSRIVLILETAFILGVGAIRPEMLPHLLWAGLGMATASLTLLYAFIIKWWKGGRIDAI